MAKKIVNNDHLLQVYHCDIFRFCDRWCEKCDHTSNCFYFNLITFNSDKELSIAKKDLEYLLTSNINTTSRKVIKGIKIDRELYKLKNQNSSKFYIASFNSTIKAKQYSSLVNEWFSTLLDCDVDINIKKYSNAGCFKAPMKELKSSISLIRRYQDLIEKKLNRATQYKFERNENFERGYAKLDIVLIKSSIKAWIKLYNICTANKQKSLEIIKHLEGLLLEVKKCFPGAESYYRIGHD